MTEQPNPYAPADVDTRAPIGAPSSQGLSAQDLKKLEALVKDANQFWIAIIMCVVCSSVGALIIAHGMVYDLCSGVILRGVIQT